MAEVVPVMTNNYEENILRGVRDSSYSLESSIELLQKDVVQLHAPRYQSMRRVRTKTNVHLQSFRSLKQWFSTSLAYAPTYGLSH